TDGAEVDVDEDLVARRTEDLLALQLRDVEILEDDATGCVDAATGPRRLAPNPGPAVRAPQRRLHVTGQPVVDGTQHALNRGHRSMLPDEIEDQFFLRLGLLLFGHALPRLVDARERLRRVVPLQPWMR